MVNKDGSSTFQGENIQGLNMDETATWKGTALPSGGGNDIPQGGYFTLTALSGSDVAGVYEQTNATKSTPTWVLRYPIPEPLTAWPSAPVVGQMVYNSTTKQTAMCSSIDPIVFGDVYIRDDFTSYASDGDFDDQYPTDNATDLSADSTGNQVDWIGDCFPSTNGFMSHRLGALPERFVFRCKVDVDTLTQGAQTQGSTFAIGFRDSMLRVSSDTVVDIYNYMLKFTIHNSEKLVGVKRDSDSTTYSPDNLIDTNIESGGLVVDEYYCEMVFNGNIVTTKVFTTADFSTTQFGSTVTDVLDSESTADTISGFNTLEISVNEQSSGDSSLRGTLDWWEIHKYVIAV